MEKKKGAADSLSRAVPRDALMRFAAGGVAALPGGAV
jgi:hypothetical protein